MIKFSKKIQKCLKSTLLIVVTFQFLSFILIGPVIVNKDECCKNIVEEKQCYSLMADMETENHCEMEIPQDVFSLSNCGCIHTQDLSSNDYLVQNKYEISKESSVTLVVDTNYRIKINKIFSTTGSINIQIKPPPIFLIDSSFLI